MIPFLLFIFLSTISFSYDPPEYPMILNLSLKFVGGSVVGDGYVYAVDCNDTSIVLSEKVRVERGIATKFLLVSKPRNQEFCLVLVYKNLLAISNSSIRWENELPYYNLTLYFYRPNFKCHKYDGWYFNGSLFLERYCPGKCEYRKYYWYLNECKYKVVKSCRSECARKGECTNKKLCVKMLGKDDICLRFLEVECCSDEDCNGGKCVGYVCEYYNKSKGIAGKEIKNASKSKVREIKVLFRKGFLLLSKNEHASYVKSFLEKELNKSVEVFPLNVSVTILVYRADKKVYTNVTFKLFSSVLAYIPREIKEKMVGICGEMRKVNENLYELYPGRIGELTLIFSGYFLNEIYDVEMYSYRTSGKIRENFSRKGKENMSKEKELEKEKKNFKKSSKKGKNEYMLIAFAVLFVLSVIINYFSK